ncbi:MAG: hypothetical protein BWZ11_01132 [Bacteroidetes bacterium ADurb.BinA395]|nr:MAG: hypothetical protein BWZ11_01132 [Bacteroidetes bacterium ADurb.BinA395]
MPLTFKTAIVEVNVWVLFVLLVVGLPALPILSEVQFKIPAPEIVPHTSLAEVTLFKVTPPLTVRVTPLLTVNVPKFPVVGVLKYKLLQAALAVTVTV